MEGRKPKWWRIFLTAYAAGFAFLAAITPDAFSKNGLLIVAIFSLVIALACQGAFHLLWPAWKGIADHRDAEGGWIAAAKSLRHVKWTRAIAVVLTSKLFFLTSCTGGMIVGQLAGNGIESGTRGDHVRPLDKRMSVIAMVPNPKRPGERKVVETTLQDLEKFKKDNPDYSFVLPAGKGELSGNRPMVRTDYSVAATGADKVLVETKYHDDEHHVLGRYAATGKEIEPLYTKTNHDFADFMTGMIFGVPLAFVLALLGYLLEWWQKRRESAVAGNESQRKRA